MKKITLLGAALVDGEMRFPSYGVIETTPERADELIAGGLAVHDTLDTDKVEDLRAEAARIGLSIGPKATKPELVEAIRARRANRA